MAKVKQIIFDVKLNDKIYKDVTLDYPEENDWCLYFRDLHNEDNDSWCLVELEDNLVVDFQMYGDDDSKGIKSKLAIQGNIMVKSDEGDWYDHTTEWFGSYNTYFSNVKIITDNGIILVNLYTK